MGIDVQDLAKYLGSTFVIVTAVAWLARRVIDQWLSQRLEGHKTQLNQASEHALEERKSQLRVQELRESRLVEEQASIIAEVFSRLERLHGALDNLAAPILHEGGRALALRETAIETFNEFTGYYHERAIWLERETCDKLNELVKLLGILLSQLSANLTDEGEVADRSRWVETYNRIKDEIPAARADLDTSFRSALGVSKAPRGSG